MHFLMRIFQQLKKIIYLWYYHDKSWIIDNLPYNNEWGRKYWSYQSQKYDTCSYLPHTRFTCSLRTLWNIQWLTTSTSNPTIMQSAMEYPYTIVFRICMMYSLFITFLELLFIKWWIDSFPIYKHTNFMVFFGAIGLAGYGLFVSCIDRKRINYVLASQGVTVSAVSMAISIFLIMKNLTANRAQGIALASESSWLYKRLFSLIYGIAFVSGVLMYSGYLDVNYKPIVEYASVISCSLFFWSFTIEFKKFKMDVERFNNPTR